MDTFRTTSKTSKIPKTSVRPVRFARFAKPGLALGLAMTFTLAGCSGGSPDQGASGEASTGPAPQTSQAAGQNPESGGTTMEETTSSSPGVLGTNPQNDSASPGPSTALSGGLGEARERAESWNDDAELYGIASLQATVNAKGKNEGWLYSFVSDSTGSVISVPYVDGQLRNAQGQELPEGQIRRIVEDTLPISELVDSSEAIKRSDEVRSYLQENPEAGASAGLDSGSGNEAEWILSVPSEALQDRVPAAK